MSAMTVEGLSEEAMEHLSSRAQRHDRSPEGEARAILEAHLTGRRELAERIVSREVGQYACSATQPPVDRREAVDRIIALQQRLHARYGEMPDSTDLIREDRAR